MTWKLTDLNEIVKVKIDQSDMVAILSIREDERLNEEIPLHLMIELLKQQQIIYGIDEQLLSLICKHPLSYSEKQIEIAKGLKPIHGENAKIKWVILEEKERNKPKVVEGDRVDYYSVNTIINVKKGELIAQKIPATKGEEGKTVRGKTIPAKPGKDLSFKIGKNVVLNETKDSIYASVDGQVVIDDKVQVLPIYEVKGDVDFSVGNIDFVGTVIVSGNVLDGFKIHALDDIKIFGYVEGAELISKRGNIEIQQGVIGYQRSTIRAAKSVKALYIMDATVYAGENVHISQSIMRSEIIAGKEVICLGTKGLIVGGQTNAGTKVIASIIGNHLATPTSIEVGINPMLREELRELQEKKRENFQLFDKIEKAIHFINRLQRTMGDLPPNKQSLLTELLNQKSLIEKRMKELDLREKTIEINMNMNDQSSIEVQNVIYPGVKLVIGKQRKFIKDVHKCVKFIFEEGEIVSRQLLP
ncbi:DUF342 domain-containing protein [Tepidibacillus fermentans]|uniref:Flagellar Assembly Protein A N-terminal region domain-containing protein n=1 Tax=Tepidibacillus fermentans TaxID=1281767 RepID=A0A4R3KHM1_9BACI|nr:FapA family protein [Tepidibacillus fermentans]TCS82965.1 hypothetical protein EDD72_10748 [Tepidibacillus fermentans]